MMHILTLKKWFCGLKMNLITGVDKTLFTWINAGWSNPVFDVLMPLISHAADPLTMWLWIPLLGFAAYREYPSQGMQQPGILSPVPVSSAMRYMSFCLRMALIYGLNAGVYQLLKHAVHRPRPFVVQDAVTRVLLTDIQHYCSFPSGHAANAFMVAVILSSLHKRKWPVFYSAAFLVSLSRVYLGVHYPLDVLAGAVLGLGLTRAVLRIRQPGSL